MLPNIQDDLSQPGDERVLSAVSCEEDYENEIKAEDPLKARGEYKRQIDPTKAALDKIMRDVIQNSTRNNLKF